MPEVISVLFGLIVSALLVFLIVLVIKEWYYPSKKIIVEITNKRISNADEALDYYIINYGSQEIESHFWEIREWKNKQLEKCSDESKKQKLYNRWKQSCKRAFKFQFYRTKTRYRQVNYVRHPYKVNVIEYSFSVSDEFVLGRLNFLESHGFYVTYDQFHKEDQRKALTPKLRQFIKERDNYTCQICGKYMPDEVGLHIDHIIPISKGGKSTPENLRVLCSKCNGRKSNK